MLQKVLSIGYFSVEEPLTQLRWPPHHLCKTLMGLKLTWMSVQQQTPSAFGELNLGSSKLSGMWRWAK